MKCLLGREVVNVETVHQLQRIITIDMCWYRLPVLWDQLNKLTDVSKLVYIADSSPIISDVSVHHEHVNPGLRDKDLLAIVIEPLVGR